MFKHARDCSSGNNYRSAIASGLKKYALLVLAMNTCMDSIALLSHYFWNPITRDVCGHLHANTIYQFRGCIGPYLTYQRF